MLFAKEHNYGQRSCMIASSINFDAPAPKLDAEACGPPTSMKICPSRSSAAARTLQICTETPKRAVHR